MIMLQFLSAISQKVQNCVDYFAKDPEEELTTPTKVLHHAVKKGDLRKIKFMISLGYNLNETDEIGFNALHHAY